MSRNTLVVLEELRHVQDIIERLRYTIQHDSRFSQREVVEAVQRGNQIVEQVLGARAVKEEP